jgi:hypothetical protein
LTWERTLFQMAVFSAESARVRVASMLSLPGGAVGAGVRIAEGGLSGGRGFAGEGFVLCGVGGVA